MKARMLSSLRALRQLRESRASDALARSRNAFDRARRQADSAAAATAHYASESRMREKRLIAALLGRPVALGEVHGLQSDLDGMSIEAQRLRDAEVRAHAALHERSTELSAARELYYSRQKDTIKIDGVAKQETARDARRTLAVDEASADDWRNAGGVHAAPDPRRTS